MTGVRRKEFKPIESEPDMVDFKQLAQGAKAKHDAEVEKQKRKAQQEAEARIAYVDRAIAVLNEHVVPLLDKAAAEFKGEGIELRITKRYDKHSLISGDPDIVVACLSQPRASDRYQCPAESFFFCCDGARIRAGRAAEEFSDRMKVPMGTTEPSEATALVERVMAEALDAYFVMLKKYGYPIK